MGKRSGKSSALKLFFYSGTAVLLIASLVSVLGALIGFMDPNTASLAFTVCLSLLFSFSVISYLLRKGKRPRLIIKELGLSRKALTWKMVGYGAILFLIYLAILFGFATFSQLTGIQISSNVQQVIGSYPVWALVFISIVAPLNEEIAFRAFLVPRIGVLFSGLIFAVLHLGYGSISEIAVALWFGLTGGYVFKKTKSLYPSLITHMAVNSLTAVSIFAFIHYGGPMLILVH
jgi:membrane protease YdiL (CAAX protease family)